MIAVSGDDPLSRTARIQFGGVVKEANLALVPEAQADSWVLVHAGVAIGVIDEAEAQRTLEALESLEEPDVP